MALTPADFLAFYPQFSSFAQGVVLPEYLRQANARFSFFSDEDAEEARRLYAAHKLTLYAASSLPDGVSPTSAAIASAGRGAMQEIASKKVGEVSVSYSSGYSVSGSFSTDPADLTKTVYGLQLLSLLQLYSHAQYIP